MTRDRATRASKITGQVLAWIGVSFAFILTVGGTRAEAANLFATVVNGALVNGSGAVSSTSFGPGMYEVTFSSNVSACAYVATTVNTYTQAIQVFTAGGHLSANGVYVETKNQGGGLMEGSFHLAVVCGGVAKKHFAVVDYAGSLVRGSAGATLASPSPGRYNITFLANVKSCAYLATVADPGNGLVYTPAGVYTGSGANAQTVYVETKNTGGGLTDEVPFHLAVICAAPKTSFAVVNGNGLPARSSVLTSAFRSGAGRYAVVEGANINNCATVATRGSVNKSVPFSPATVELLAGPAPNTIGIEVRNLLAFGGTVLDEAFHAATFCQ